MQSTVSIDQTDQDLARNVRAGSLDCFEELVRRYQVPLLRFLERRSANRHDAEDAVQEAFLRAYQSIGSYREGEPFKPWLFTIAYHIAIDKSRKRWPRLAAVDDVSIGNETGPFAQAARNDADNHLWKIVRRVLKDEPFTTVWLHYGESMSTEDIAKVIGRSRVWVKTTLLRSRAKIKIVLEAGHE
jgi:RNA polymerase sigma-70 factor (ECF subfamily)